MNVHADARSLRQTLIISLVLGFLLLAGAQYYVTGRFVERQLLEVESREAFARLRNLHHALDVLEEDLVSTTADWSQWDEAYAYTQHKNPGFPKANVDPGTLARLRLSAILVTDQDGRVTLAQALSADEQSLVPATVGMVKLAEKGGTLVSTRRDRDRRSGLVAIDGELYLASSQPVLDATGELPPRGRLIMLRSFPRVVLPALMKVSGQTVKVAPFDRAVPRAYATRRVVGEDQVELSEHNLLGTTPISDLSGRPVAELRFSIDRPMQAVVSDTRQYLFVATSVLALLFFICAIVTVRAKVVMPLERLASTVAAIGTRGVASSRLDPSHGAREFKLLTASINTMLERLELQQTLQRDRDAALEANRLKSEFLATMSHEIRTPMNGVLGMCELLQRTELNPRQKHLAETVVRSARSLLGILNDVLDFSKIESGKLELEEASFAPAELVHSIAAPFVSAAQIKGLEFSVRIESGVPTELLGDALRLRQVLNNLLSNAVKFTPKGAISLSCSPMRSDARYAHLKFVVADTGIGIDEISQRRIFDPFAQAESSTSRRYGGTGLGLAIVRRLVTLMKGTIQVQSKVGEGTTFTFTVQLKRVHETPAQSIPADLATGARFSLNLAPRVLLAEDNEVNREVLTEMLEYLGCRVTATAHGQQALAAASAQEFDVIFMDSHMPEMDGPAATRKIRELQRGSEQRPAYIVALTADATPENQDRCLRAGANVVATKPISQARLRDLILQGLNAPAGAVA